jgi:hypothetical protein
MEVVWIPNKNENFVFIYSPCLKPYAIVFLKTDGGCASLSLPIELQPPLPARTAMPRHWVCGRTGYGECFLHIILGVFGAYFVTYSEQYERNWRCPHRLTASPLLLPGSILSQFQQSVIRWLVMDHWTVVSQSYLICLNIRMLKNILRLLSMLGRLFSFTAYHRPSRLHPTKSII